MTILEIQKALKARGFDPGPLDGIWGRKTIAAVKAFQSTQGLVADGIVGAHTIAAFNATSEGHRYPLPSSNPGRPVWYAEADRLKGIRETAGKGNNATIMGWAKGLGGWVASFFTADSIPWCGLFVGHVIATTLPSEPLPSNPLGALNWLKFGRTLDKPALGAIVVFKRPGGGHVGFYAGEDANAIHVLGGNQSDQVNVTRIAKSRLQGYRWPTTAPLPAGGRVLVSGGGKLSTNEA